MCGREAATLRRKQECDTCPLGTASWWREENASGNERGDMAGADTVELLGPPGNPGRSRTNGGEAYPSRPLPNPSLSPLPAPLTTASFHMSCVQHP